MKNATMSDWEAIWGSVSPEMIIQEFDKGCDYGDRLKLRKIRKWLNINKKDMNDFIILESGCGTARVSLSLVREKGKFIGVDYSISSLKLCRALSAHVALGNRAQSVQADIFNLPFKSNSFNLTWNAGVLEHYDKKSRVAILTEMKRVTKPFGCVIIFVPNMLCFRWSLKYHVYNLLEKLRIENGWPYGKEKMQTYWSMKRLFKKVGFDYVEVDGICFSPLPIFNPDKSISTAKVLGKGSAVSIHKWIKKLHLWLEDYVPILPRYFGKNIVIKGR